MPGPKTHQIFYTQLKDRLSEETLLGFPNYDKYSIFSQGHDLILYHNFYKIYNQKKLNYNIRTSEMLQEYKFQEFVFNFLKTAQDNRAIDNEQIRLFIGPAYIMHHILDAYTHPLIIYYAGDHIRDSNNTTWMHGIVENLIDIYLMENLECINHKKYKVYKDFIFDNQIIDEVLVKTIDESVYKTYNIKGYGKIFLESFSQVSLYIRIFKYDYTGLKKIIFNLLDPVLKGTSSFSYHRNYEDVLSFLNNEHNTWLNPMDATIKSNKSFMDLYLKALEDGAKIVDGIEKICKSENICREDVYSVIPNIASTHGLRCNQKLIIHNKRE